MDITKSALAAVAAVTLSVGATQAATTFEGSFAVTEYASSDPGLVVQIDPTSGSFGPYNLEVGESSGWFDMFDIWTDERAMNLDDFAVKDISVDMNFSSPLVNTVVDGVTSGWTFFGLFSGGAVTWTDPVTVNFGSGGSGEFKLYLSDESFGLKGEKYGATVKGKIVYTVAAVPLPAGGVLLLTALGGLALARRRKA